METINKHESLKLLTGDFSFEMVHEQPYLPTVSIKNFGKIIDIETYSINQKQTNLFLKRNLAGFKNNIYTLSKEFEKAIDFSIESFEKLIKDNIDYVFNHLKYNTGICIKDNVASYYNIDKEQRTISVCIFVDDVMKYALQGLDISSIKQENINKIKLGMYIPGNTHPDNWSTIINASSSIAYDIFYTCVFRTFADHEYKLISGKSSAKLNNNVFKNNNKQSVLVLDSSWYTSIIRTEGFAVRGHLRMQACGKNLSERRLVYIDSFQKYGYVRKAKMLPTEVDSISEILN